MKKLLMILPLVLVICFAFNCKKGEETELLLDKEEDVKIEIENGIQVVYNPKNPSPLPGTPSQLILREELCIGDEEGEELIFSRIRAVQVDDKENIYVLDSKEACVKVFDKNGKHLRTFGERGQGPGELQNPLRMYLVAGKEILILSRSNSRLSFYSLQGKCLREISTGKYWLARTIPDSKGNIIAELVIWGNKPITEIKKFDPNFNPIMTIEAIEEILEMKPYVVSDLVYSHFNVRVIKNDYIVWGYPQDHKYEIFVVNPEGKTIRKIVKDYDPVKVTEEDKEELKKKRFGNRKLPANVRFEFPKNYYPYHVCLCGDDGRIYVRTYEQNNEGNLRHDVFSPEGRYIAKYYLPEIDRICLVRKNKMYTMVRDDEKAIPVVKRYSLVWK